MPRLHARSFDDPAWAFVMKGARQLAKRRLHDAIASFTTALNAFNERTPARAVVEAYICRGAAYGEAGNEQAAIEDFSRAIALDGQNGMAYYNRGYARQMLGQYDLAVEDFSRSIELRPTGISSYIRRGVCRKKLKDVSGARSDFAEARKLIAAEKR